MYRVFINGEECDLSYTNKISISKKVFDLSNIGQRGVRFTNSFTIPVTAKNIRLFGNPNVLSSNNNSFEVTRDYTLEDNNTIVSKGRAIVREFDEKKGIKIQLSEGVDFWDVVGGLRLKDLVLDSFDFAFTAANMNARNTLSSNDIFVTALHDAGDPSDTALVSFDKTRPFLRFKPIIDQIAIRTGFSINYNDILSNTELNFTACSSNADRFVLSDYRRRFENENVNGILSITNGSLIFDLGHINETSTTLSNTTYKTSFVLKGSVTCDVPSTIRFVFNDRVESFFVPRGSSIINFISDENEIGSTFQIETNENILFENVLIYSHVTENEIFDVDNSYSAINDFFVLSDYNMPEITCKELIKIIMKMFFLNVDTDNFKKEISFTRFVDDLNTNNFADIKGDIVRNNSWSSGSVYGKINYLAYNNDENLDVDLGRATFPVENINAQDEKNFVRIDSFSASEEIVVSGNTVVSYPIYSPTEVSRESVRDRIVFLKDIGTFGINAVFSDISFTRLFSSYYFSFTENTLRERVITLKAFITFAEFISIQRTPLIFNEDLGGLFLVTDIEQYTNEGLTTLKCVKYG